MTDSTERHANQALKALRAQHGLTQAALVEAVGHQLIRSGVLGVVPSLRIVQQWESGFTAWPLEHYRDALRVVLGVDSDAQLGFRPRGTSRGPRVLVNVVDYSWEDEVRRAEFMKAVLAISFGAVTGSPVQSWLDMDPSQTVRLSRIGASDVAAIETTTEQFKLWDFLHGGGLSLDAMKAQLNWAATLLDQGTFANSAVRTRMCTAVGNLAAVAGWAAYDAGEQQDARRILTLGVHASTEAGDWPLRAAVLADMARQAVTVGTPDKALEILGVGHYAARDGSPVGQASLHNITARAYAALGNTKETLASIGRAEDAFARRWSHEPLYLSHYDEAQLLGDGGAAMFDAARFDPSLVDRTAVRLTQAADSYGADYARSVAICQVRVAALRLQQGERTEGLRWASRFSATSAGLVSDRIATDTRMLAGMLHDSDDDEHELLVRLGGSSA